MTRYQNDVPHPDSTGIRVRKAGKEKRLAKTAELIVQRKTYEEIAEIVGVSRRQVIRYSKELMTMWAEEHFPEDRHRWRLQELQRLAAMENAITDIILNEEEPEVINENGEIEGGLFRHPYTTEAQLKAVGRAIQIMQRRAALLGLDLPREGSDDSAPIIGKIIVHVQDDHLPARPDQIEAGGNGDGILEGEFEAYHYDIEEDSGPQEAEEDLGEYDSIDEEDDDVS